MEPAPGPEERRPSPAEGATPGARGRRGQTLSILRWHAPDARFLNREQSWLQFDERVLAIAQDTDLPLLERIKFVAIFTSNLDEFFQVRVAGLHEQVDADARRIVIKAIAIVDPDIIDAQATLQERARQRDERPTLRP